MMTKIDWTKPILTRYNNPCTYGGVVNINGCDANVVTMKSGVVEYYDDYGRLWRGPNEVGKYATIKNFDDTPRIRLFDAADAVELTAAHQEIKRLHEVIATMTAKVEALRTDLEAVIKSSEAAWRAASAAINA